MLIRRAELESGAFADVRIERGVIAAIGKLDPQANETYYDAHGGLLLPGLHDHHIHVAALAASLNSVQCGPPEVSDADTFAACLQRPGHGWLRATGYHESVAGMLDARVLDRIVNDRPVRVQHRSGRMWFLNSRALDALLTRGSPHPGLERDGSRYTGRLIDADSWLQEALGSEPPSFAQVGKLLAALGVTGLTEMSPRNDAVIANHFSRETETHALPQRVLLAGGLSLSSASMSPRVQLGAAKLHLHEAHLPPLEECVEFIRRAHANSRSVAVHCVTEVELVFTLAAFEEAGTLAGDRIEHAAVAPDTAIATIAHLGLAVVSQPHFILERGDLYMRDVDTIEQPLLYRLRAFLDAQVTLAAGSDAPFGGYDPWLSMAAAVARRTRLGIVMGETEALTPEQALDLYLRAPEELERRRQVVVGAPADLCLLDSPWSAVRTQLSSVRVQATFVAGRLIFDRVDQAPA